MHVVMSAFSEMAQAETAVTNLQAAGFTSDEIGVLMRHDVIEPAEADEALVGAGVGALAGTAVGGLFGLLVGATAISIPILGPVLAGGLVATTLGAAATGAVYGTLLGLVIKLGLMGEDAQFYTDVLTNDGVLVVVEARGQRAARAWRILHEAKASRIRSTILGGVQNTAEAMPLVGLFPNPSAASRAQAQLLAQGIDSEALQQTDEASGRFSFHSAHSAVSPLDVSHMGELPATIKRHRVECRLTELGIDDSDVPFYLDAVQRGGALLIVATDDKKEAAVSRMVMKAMDATQTATPVG